MAGADVSLNKEININDSNYKYLKQKKCIKRRGMHPLPLCTKNAFVWNSECFNLFIEIEIYSEEHTLFAWYFLIVIMLISTVLKVFQCLAVQ